MFLKKRNRPVLRELLPMFLFFVMIFAFYSLANILSFYPFPNYFVYHASLPVIFFVLLRALWNLHDEIYFNAAIYRLGLLLIALIIINSFVLEKISTFNSYAHALYSFYILFVCLNYYWKKMNADQPGDILHERAFWLISGLFIYHSSSFIVFSAYQYFIEQNDQSAGLAWRFHNVMLLIMCILMTKGITIPKQET